MFRFKPEHLEKYKKADPKWGPVGVVTYKRTYSRPFTEGQKVVGRETWLDTCVRVIEGNMNLLPDDPTATEEWATTALDIMFYMGWLPPGRGLWMMGTDYAAYRGGDALNNCWYIAVRPQSYEDMDMFKGTYTFSDPEIPMPSFPFVFMFDRAMLGGGVGFGVNRQNINKYPSPTNEVDLKIVLSDTHPDWDRIKNSEEWATLPGIKDVLVTSLSPDEKAEYNVIKVTDDREGWDVSVRETIDAHWFGHFFYSQDDYAQGTLELHMDDDYSDEEISRHLKHAGVPLVIDLSDVRGYDTLINGFGGKASGPLPLIAALININKILNSRVGSKLESVDGLDIMNLLGRCVVAGNVRRTALIGLGNHDDPSYVDAKNYKEVLPIMVKDEFGYAKWEQNEFGRLVQVRKPYDECVEELGKEEADRLFDIAWKQENHRWASNNSVFTHELFEDHHFIAAGIMANGEPGMGNTWLMQNFGRIMDGYQEAIDADAEGLNPCGEVTLENGEPCNIDEVIPYRLSMFGFDLKTAFRIATQYAYRITFAKYSWPVTQRAIDKNKRIGVSLTGMQDYYLDKYGHYALKGFEVDPETGKEDLTKPIFHQKIVDELDMWYHWVEECNDEHAHLLGSTKSKKKTTNKPSGTVAKLPGVSSGIHWHYSGYMIQRIRYHEADPNLLVIKACGLPIEKAAKEPNTVVVEFPVKNANADHPNFKGAGDVSLAEQFANQYLFAYAWADNAVSATLTFKPEEKELIEPLLKAYNNRVKSTSLLPYSGHGYVQAPWEPITKEEYEKRVSAMLATPEEMYKILEVVENGIDIGDDSDCSTGACPAK